MSPPQNLLVPAEFSQSFLSVIDKLYTYGLRRVAALDLSYDHVCDDSSMFHNYNDIFSLEQCMLMKQDTSSVDITKINSKPYQ